MDETVTVLELADADEYVDRQVFRRGDAIESSSLPGFRLAVSTLFDAS